MWAYATAGVAADALYAAVAEAAVRGGLAGFNPQNLANTVWAYATAGVAADALYEAVAEAAVRGGPVRGGLVGFDSVDMARLCKGFLARSEGRMRPAQNEFCHAALLAAVGMEFNDFDAENMAGESTSRETSLLATPMSRLSLSNSLLRDCDLPQLGLAVQFRTGIKNFWR